MSRSCPSSVTYLTPFQKIHIPGEEDLETITQEVNRVIQYRMIQLSKRKRLSADLKNYLEQRLQQTTHRTYLWVYLVFDYLERETFKKTLKGVESVVATLPNSVNEVYEQILSKSKKDSMVRKVLSIILAASRPLTLSEMNVAVNIEFNSLSIRDLDLEDDKDFKSRLRSWCGLFVSIHHGKIYFIHQTAREFLLADLSPPTDTPSALHWHHSITARQAHTVLAERCVLYLNILNSDPSLMTDFMDKTGQSVENQTFLDYSTNNWGFHFREANILNGAAIVSSALKICDSSSKSFSTWFRTYWASSATAFIRATRENLLISLRNPEIPKNLTDLMIASYFGHHGVVDFLLESGAKIDQKDKNGWTALSWAAEEAHWYVVKLLLEAGAAVDCEYNVRYVERLGLGRGIRRYHHNEGYLSRYRVQDLDRNTSRGYGLVRGEHKRTPLSRAAENGDEAVVKVLIETGKADVNWKSEKTWTPLLWAIKGGHWAVVKLLLRAGAEVHYEYDVSYVVDGGYEETTTNTPLSRATEIGDEVIVELLLGTRKAHVEWADKKGWRSLSWAVEGRLQGIVKLLLKAGATVHFEYNVYSEEVVPDRHARAIYNERVYRRTPLSRAAEKGDEAIVKLLVEIGKADVDCEDEKGWTPLSWAVEGSHWATVRELVKAGANIHHEYEVFENYAWHPCTPLSRANEKGQEDINNIVLEASHIAHAMAPKPFYVLQGPDSTFPDEYIRKSARNRKRRRS